MKMDPVLTKRQNYRLWQSGAFGNKLRAWRTIEEWRASGFAGVVSLRVVSGAGGRCSYDIAPSAVDRTVAWWLREGVSRDAIMVNESAPNDAVILQGEYDNASPWNVFYYSTARYKMRNALRVAPQETRGLRSDMLLRGAMTPSSYEDWRALLDQYPGHVLEVSVYDRCLGDIPGRNALVWEVRRY